MRLTVSEYQFLRIGEQGFTQAHWETMAIFHDQVSSKYFSLVHKGIRFSNFVGILQVGSLTIEILPKLKTDSTTSSASWQRALIDMLRVCKLLKVDSLSSVRQTLRPDAILELYFTLFLEEVEQLLRQGLVKKYHRRSGNLNMLKGRLLHSQQMRKNAVHLERFYTEYETYSYDHPYNRILLAGLKLAANYPLEQSLAVKTRRLLQQFPELPAPVIRKLDLEQLQFDRKTERYRTAVEAAILLLKNYHPALSAGSFEVLALLFDMNLLFEEYIYRQLFRLQSDQLKVYRQMSRPFWGRRYLKPDIVLEWKGIRYIIDTKWKITAGNKPSMEDLRQIYTYIRQFNAQRGLLIYPEFSTFRPSRPVPFNYPDGGESDFFCQIIHLPLMKNNMLNQDIAHQLLELLTIR